MEHRALLGAASRLGEFAHHRVEGGRLVRLEHRLRKFVIVLRLVGLYEVEVILLAEHAVLNGIAAAREEVGVVVVDDGSVVEARIGEFHKVPHRLGCVLTRKLIPHRIVVSVEGIGDGNFGMIARASRKHANCARADDGGGESRGKAAYKLLFHRKVLLLLPLYCTRKRPFRQAVCVFSG